MVKRADHPGLFFTREEKRRIVRAIREAEKETTGDIRVHLDTRTRGTVMERAREVFRKQQMFRVLNRNAVLIYLSLADRSFAIIGDEGIHRLVGDEYWQGLAGFLGDYFRRGEFLTGLEYAIRQVGQRFHEHFPEQPRKR